MDQTKKQIKNLKSGQIFHENHSHWFIILKVKYGLVDYLEGSNANKLIKKKSTIEELQRYLAYSWEPNMYWVKFGGVRKDIELLIKKYLD